MKRAAIFLDRDGVLNKAIVRNGKPYPPASTSEVEILPGVVEALRSLRGAGYPLVVVTNQPDVARGTTTRERVDELNERLRAELPLDAIYTCFHDGAEGCACRKPKPGLLLQAAQDMALDLPLSFMVGDRWRDIEAGRSVGMRTFFIDYRYDEEPPESYDFRVASLEEATRIILNMETMK